MQIKTVVLMIFVSFYSLSSLAQIDMKAEETKVITALKKLRSDKSDLDRSKAALQFEQTLKKVLSYKESLNYPFSELQKYINIETSKDKKIRTFSWDNLSGGSWHALQNLIQFRTDNKLHVISFQKENPNSEEGNDMFADAAILNIHRFYNGYLFEGYGTYGSGNHHKVIAYYELIDNKLVRKPIFETKKDIYALIIPRRYKFDLIIDATKGTITHSEYVMDDDIGFAQPTGKKVLLAFNGQQFVKQNKN